MPQSGRTQTERVQWFKAWKLGLLGLQLHSGPPRLRFSPCSRRGNVATDKSRPPPERQAGRSAQLQDASAGGPEEGCSAVHPEERRRAVQRKTGASRLCQSPTGRLEREKGCKRGRCGLAEEPARSLGNVRGFPEQLWSPGRPLAQSANVHGVSVPRLSMHSESWESLQISNGSNARPGTMTQRLTAEHSQDTTPQKSVRCKTAARKRRRDLRGSAHLCCLQTSSLQLHMRFAEERVPP